MACRLLRRLLHLAKVLQSAAPPEPQVPACAVHAAASACSRSLSVQPQPVRAAVAHDPICDACARQTTAHGSPPLPTAALRCPHCSSRLCPGGLPPSSTETAAAAQPPAASAAAVSCHICCLLLPAWPSAQFRISAGTCLNLPSSLPTLRPTAAKAVQVIAEVLAVLYAEAALLVQLQALLRANVFLAKYR